jgi:hypothetical protein
VLVPFFAILAFVSSQTGFSIHSRYVIPALPFLFVWISKVVRVFAPRVATPATNTVQPVLGLTPRGKGAKVDWLSASWRLCVSLFSIRTMRALVVIALVWSVASSLGIYPHSLSYFNELAAILPTPTDASYPKLIGGQDKDRGLASRVGRALTAGPRNGPRHLLDSNIDWGQDLFYLKDWLIDHPGVKLDGLSYHGSYPVVLAGVSWDTPYPPPGPTNREKELEQQTVASIMGFAADQFGPQPGWYAVAVNYIYDYSGKHRYFLHFEPEAMAGYSIYIYHITLDEANRVRRELGLPELRGG